MFRNLSHARAVLRDWAEDCYANRSHSALGYETPRAFAERLKTTTGSRTTTLEGCVNLPIAKPALKGASARNLVWVR